MKQSFVVARHNVFFVESVFPFKEKKPSFTHWESLHKLIGRKNAITEVHDFDNLLPDTRSDLEPAAAASPTILQCSSNSYLVWRMEEGRAGKAGVRH